MKHNLYTRGVSYEVLSKIFGRYKRRINGFVYSFACGFYTQCMMHTHVCSVYNLPLALISKKNLCEVSVETKHLVWDPWKWIDQTDMTMYVRALFYLRRILQQYRHICPLDVSSEVSPKWVLIVSPVFHTRWSDDLKRPLCRVKLSMNFIVRNSNGLFSNLIWEGLERWSGRSTNLDGSLVIRFVLYKCDMYSTLG